MFYASWFHYSPRFNMIGLYIYTHHLIKCSLISMKCYELLIFVICFFGPLINISALPPTEVVTYIRGTPIFLHVVLYNHLPAFTTQQSKRESNFSNGIYSNFELRLSYVYKTDSNHAVGILKQVEQNGLNKNRIKKRHRTQYKTRLVQKSQKACWFLFSELNPRTKILENRKQNIARISFCLREKELSYIECQYCQVPLRQIPGVFSLFRP